MRYILQVDFSYHGPWGQEMTAVMKPLAESIATEPGLIWKIWTENPANEEAGGIYLFDSEINAQNYLAMHTARLAGFGIAPVSGKIFAVNDALSLIDRAPF
jgi:hypothetical protein